MRTRLAAAALTCSEADINFAPECASFPGHSAYPSRRGRRSRVGFLQREEQRRERRRRGCVSVEAPGRG
jgi:hypothetical protein